MDLTIDGFEDTSLPKLPRKKGALSREGLSQAKEPSPQISSHERKLEGQLHAFELVPCLNEALEDWSHQFPRKRVIKLFEDEFHDPLIGDAASLFALLQSMLRWTSRHSEGHSLRLTLKGDHLFSSETHLAFSLTLEAQQIGFSIEEREGDDHQESTWSRQLIQRLGGELRVEQSQGGYLKLSTRLRFPKGTHPIVDMASALDGIRVLVVDDDSMSRMLTATMLRSLQAQVVTARHGLEAVALAKMQVFDMVFLDIEMPEMDGVVTCGILRQIPGYEHVPVLALTSHEQEEQHSSYLEHGMQEVMVKPVGKLNIIEAAQRYLRRAPSVKSVRRDLLKNLAIDAALDAEAAREEAAYGALALRWVQAVELRDAFADSREVLELCITVFSRRYPTLLEELEGALAKEILLDAMRAAHELKGMLANLWVPSLSALAADIEDWTREGVSEGCRERIGQLRSGIPEGLEELQAVLKDWPFES